MPSWCLHDSGVSKITVRETSVSAALFAEVQLVITLTYILQSVFSISENNVVKLIQQFSMKATFLLRNSLRDLRGCRVANQVMKKMMSPFHCWLSMFQSVPLHSRYKHLSSNKPTYIIVLFDRLSWKCRNVLSRHTIYNLTLQTSPFDQMALITTYVL